MSTQYEPYDYAYLDPGWNSQDPQTPPIPPPIDPWNDPGLPSDVNKTQVIGNFMDPVSGLYLEGYLMFRNSDILIYTTTGVELLPTWGQFWFNQASPLSIMLPSTDNTTITTTNPAGWVWEFELSVQGVVQQFVTPLPYSDTPVNIYSLTPGTF